MYYVFSNYVSKCSGFGGASQIYSLIYKWVGILKEDMQFI